MKIIIYACIFIATLYSSISFAQTKKVSNICKEITNQKGARAFLVNDEGNEFLKELNVGDLDKSNAKSDYFYGRKKFRLVLKPANLSIESDVSLAHCVDVKKINSQCSATAEFSLRACVNPKKFGPGKFVFETPFRILDAKLDMTENPDVKFSFDQKIVGNIQLAWFGLVDSQAQVDAVQKMMQGKSGEAILEFKNIGNLPAKIEAWIDDSQTNKELVLQSKHCDNKQLMPQESCMLRLIRNREVPPTQKLYSWVTQNQNGDAVILYLEKNRNGAWHASVANK